MPRGCSRNGSAVRALDGRAAFIERMEDPEGPGGFGRSPRLDAAWRGLPQAAPGLFRFETGGVTVAVNEWDIVCVGPVAAVQIAIEREGLAGIVGRPAKRDRTALYRHYDAAGSLLYVGISRSAAARLAQHSASRWDRLIARVEVEHFDTREQAKAAERRAIIEEKPRHNKMHAAG